MPSAILHQPVDETRELRHVDPSTQDRLRDLATPAMPLQRLKRTGLRPHLFNGVTIATVCGVTPTLPFWYEINVYRALLNGYVSDVRLFHNSADRPDLFRVTEHAELYELIDHLERYNPAGDLSPPELLRSHTAVELTLQIARLQLEVDQIVQHYRALLGELLAAITPKP